jgi:hypothetical protein
VQVRSKQLWNFIISLIINVVSVAVQVKNIQIEIRILVSYRHTLKSIEARSARACPGMAGAGAPRCRGRPPVAPAQDPTGVVVAPPLLREGGGTWSRRRVTAAAPRADHCW